MAKLCAAGITLRDQVNKTWPSRDKASDGWIGDAAHASRDGWGTNGQGSYHNPDPKGIVHAIDLDESFLGKGKGQKVAKDFAEQLATYCREGKDGGRIAHIVYEGQVASATANNWHFRGSGYGHFHHIHVSFTNRADYDGKKFNLPIFEKKDVQPIKPSSKKLWDGVVPAYDNVVASMSDDNLENKAAWRLACRLADLGFFKGTPVEYDQAYPWKAMDSWQKSNGWSVSPAGKYGQKAHRKLFG